MQDVFNTVFHGYWETIKIGVPIIVACVWLILGLRAYGQNQGLSNRYRRGE